MLTVENVSIGFQNTAGFRVQPVQTVISSLDVTVNAGEVVAVVGASGSGKSLLAHALLGLLPPNAVLGGTMMFDGAPLTAARCAHLRGREIALVPQSVAALDPLMRIGAQTRRAATLRGVARQTVGGAVEAAFTAMGLPPATQDHYPFALSGGMARRALVSTAVVGRARLFVADEPTPGLHPAVVEATLAQLRAHADDGCGVLLITHDLESALRVANRVAVFYAGTTVEIADAQAAAAGAWQHPYSRALWQALPGNGMVALAGTQPQPDALPAGCAFAPRCPLVSAACQTGRPTLRPVRGGAVRCIHAG